MEVIKKENKMKFKSLSTAFAGLILSASCLVNVANAGFIDYGSLSLEQAGDKYVTDTLNNLEWLRWDQVDHLNYSQLLLELGAGGEYEGWTIANNDYANRFTNALFTNSGVNNSTCDSVTGGGVCATPFNFHNFIQLMGNNYGQSGMALS